MTSSFTAGRIARSESHILFCGLRGGAKGFNRSQARVGNLRARFRCLGGIDADPAAVRDFERLAGVRGTVLDLFSRDDYRAFHGREAPTDFREAALPHPHWSAPMSYDPADFCDDIVARCVELGLLAPRSVPEGDLAALSALVIGALDALAAQLPGDAGNPNLHNCRRALWHLARAREALATAPRSLERVRLAISSTKGAIRNARNKPFRTQ